MILQNSVWEPWLVDAINSGYYRDINLILWIAATITMFVVALLFFNRSRTRDLYISQKWNFWAFGFFMLMMSLTRISFILSYHYESYYNLFLVIGYTFGSLALFPLVWIYEKYIITQTKRFFSIIGFLLIIFSIIFLFIPSLSELNRTIQQIGMPIIGGSFIILYLWMIRKTTGNIRKRAILTLLGMILWCVGMLLDSENLIVESLSGNFIWIVNLGAILMIVGAMCMLIFHKLSKLTE